MRPVLFCGERSSMNHHNHYYQHIAQKMAFGSLMAPDENVIRAVYLGPQQHTSLHHTMWLLGNRTQWQPGIGGGLWINGENTSVSTQCSGQAAAHRYITVPRKERFSKWENYKHPRAHTITRGEQNYWGSREIHVAKQKGWREEGVWKIWWFTSVCLCGRRRSAPSSRLLQLISPAVFHALSQLQQSTVFLNILQISYTRPHFTFYLFTLSCNVVVLKVESTPNLEIVLGGGQNGNSLFSVLFNP